MFALCSFCTPPFSLSLSLSVSHSFLLFLPLLLFLVHMNTSKHTDLRKIFFSFSLESGIQFCAIIGTPYWISPVSYQTASRNDILLQRRRRPLGNEGHTIAISRVKFTERYFAIQWKGIQSVRESGCRVFLSPLALHHRIRRTDSSTCTRDFESKISPRIDIA